MTPDTRFDRSLLEILEDLYPAPSPQYRDEALAAVARTRQRRSWTFPGRWLPMVDITMRPVLVSRVPIRALTVALLIAGLLAAALMSVGARRSLVAPPFGPARNGIVTWALDGDIFTGDAGTGLTQRIVAGEDIDRNPMFSPDGTHLSFLRQVPAKTGQFDVVVTHPDGTVPVTLTSVPISTPSAVEWAPDGASLLVNDGDGRLVQLFLDGSPAQVVADGVLLEPNAFRPPSGGQILYERLNDRGSLYLMNVDGSGARRVFAPSAGSCACPVAGPARWSPDGRAVAVPLQVDADQARLFVIDAESGALRQLANQPGVWVENDPAWSPDGTRVAFNRWQRDEAGTWQIRSIALADAERGAITALGIAPAAEGALIEWAPDGQSILSLPGTLVEAFAWSPNANGTVARPVVLDLRDGTSRQIEWSVGSTASWQRLAP